MKTVGHKTKVNYRYMSKQLRCLATDYVNTQPYNRTAQNLGQFVTNINIAKHQYHSL